MILDFPQGQERPNDKLTQDEKELLQLFRSLTSAQQEFYLESGKILMRHNNKSGNVIPIKPDE